MAKYQGVTEQNFQPGVYAVIGKRRELEKLTRKLGIKYIPPLSRRTEGLVVLSDHGSFTKLHESGVEYSTNGHRTPRPLDTDDLALLVGAGVDPKDLNWGAEITRRNDVYVIDGNLGGQVGVVKNIDVREGLASVVFRDGLYQEVIPLNSLVTLEQSRQRKQ